MANTTNPIANIISQASASTGTVQQISQGTVAFYHSYLPLFEAASVLISLILFTFVVYFIVKTGWFATRVDRVRDVILKSDMSKKRAQDSWKKAQAHFFAGDDNDLKIAIMEADKIFEDALRRAGVRGITMGDRLKNVKKEQIPNLDDVWQAHKLRNQIAHETGFKIKRDLAERALAIYEQALHNLGVLD